MALEKTKQLAQIIDLLEPLSDEERLRMVNAALTFLGSTQVSLSEPRPPVPPDDSIRDEGSGTGTPLPSRASRWMQQNAVNETALENVFHFKGGEVEVIAADVPGSEMKEKTRHCYLLSGIRSLLQEGEPRVVDDQARALCRAIGCYDAKNHAINVRALGNLVTGSKASGFELTQPGLRAAAETIKLMTKE